MSEVKNRPSLSALAWRVGTHPRFKEGMLAALSRGALSGLTTRDDRDPAIALLDAWAAVLDVLTFYQERIANEGFLRTATERLSVQELARTIGYEPRPGVAASAWLAFTLDGSPGSPREVVIPAGTRVQSLPEKGELPQTFETSEALVARPEWNELRPRRTRTHELAAETRRFYVQGVATRLKPGDPAVLVPPPRDAKSDTPLARVILEVHAVEPDAVHGWTRVDLGLLEVPPTIPELAPPPPPALLFPYHFVIPPAASDFNYMYQPAKPDAALVSTLFAGAALPSSDLLAFARTQNWPVDLFGGYLEELPKPAGPAPPTFADKGLGLHTLRTRAAVFGHNAPRYETTPADWRTFYKDRWEGRNITQGALTGDDLGDWIYLDAVYPGVRKGGWVVLRSPGHEGVWRVAAVREGSRADYGLSARVTAVQLVEDPDQPPLTGFLTRETAVYCESETLELADPSREDAVAGTTIDLEGVHLELARGRRLVVTGELADKERPTVRSEIVEVAGEPVGAEGATQIFFVKGLRNRYRRETVTVNANVAPATHGETRREVLGGGDASRPFQSFRLRQKPLTYLSAQTPSGGASTLELRVDGVRWHEAPDLLRLGFDDRAYVLRHEDDGFTTLLFGDGLHGARVPTGVENVEAVYRTGLGTAGRVGADRLTLLATRPQGVRSVTNPLPAEGGADRDSRDEARRSAPLTVLTLDRVVSLRDYEDFARGFSGIAKARATWLWDGAARVVHLTVAGSGGAEVTPAPGSVYDSLRAALDRLRDPAAAVRVDSYGRLFFALTARVRPHPDHEPAAVRARVEARLREAFSFEARDFGQDVTLSEVLAVIQRVPGVEAAVVRRLEEARELLLRAFEEARKQNGGKGGTGGFLAVPEPPPPAERIRSSPARLDGAVVRPAEILTLLPERLLVEVEP